MRAGILAGGFGTRLQELTTEIPKPMVEVGGNPIIWHIMKIFAAQGVDRFSVALGYKSELIKEFFLQHRARRSDLEVDLASGKATVLRDGDHDEDWRVRLLETGLETMTGGRVLRLLKDCNERMLLTYGDGVSDVDIKALIQAHEASGALATVTAVRPTARFGHLEISDGKVRRFAEKRQLDEGWINGGFFVLEPQVADYVQDDSEAFEEGALRRLAEEGQLAVNYHQGFWQCMDTMRDLTLLRKLWDEGNAPWAVWR